MANKDIKSYAKENNVFLWQIADELKISVDTFTRRLRKELTSEDKEQLISIIDELSKKGA